MGGIHDELDRAGLEAMARDDPAAMRGIIDDLTAEANRRGDAFREANPEGSNAEDFGAIWGAFSLMSARMAVQQATMISLQAAIERIEGMLGRLVRKLDEDPPPDPDDPFGIRHIRD